MKLQTETQEQAQQKDENENQLEKISGGVEAEFEKRILQLH